MLTARVKAERLRAVARELLEFADTLDQPPPAIRSTAPSAATAQDEVLQCDGCGKIYELADRAAAENHVDVCGAGAEAIAGAGAPSNQHETKGPAQQ